MGETADSGINQHANNIRPAGLCRKDQRGIAFVAPGVDGGAVAQQQRHDFSICISPVRVSAKAFRYDRSTSRAGDEVFRYTLDDGFHDCTDGCDCHNLYVFDVSQSSEVTLVSFDQFGQSWCEF